MIKEFKEAEMRATAQIYKSMLVQIQALHKKDPAWAGELAISFIEFLITGEISSDDSIIVGMVEGYRESVKKAQGRYDAKVALTKESLKPIADMLNRGMKQTEIARAMGVQPPAISKKITQIRLNFPELLEISGNIGKDLESQEILETVSENDGKLLESFGNSRKVLETFGKSGNVSNVSNVSSDDDDDDNDKDDDNEDIPLASLEGSQGCAPTPHAALPMSKEDWSNLF